MSIGCIKNTNDLQNKKQEFSEYLQLMIDNEAIKEKRIKDYKNPNKPPPVPPQYKSASEQAQDLMIQEKLAIDNMKELGIDLAEVRSFVMQLEQKQDGIDNLVKLNRNYPAFKKLISEKYLAKTLDAPLLLNAWEEFSANINAITGLKSVSTNSTNIYSDKSDNYAKIPTQDFFTEFKSYLSEDKTDKLGLFNNTDLSISDTVKSSFRNSLEKAIDITLTNATIAKIDDLTPLKIRDINNIAENLLTTYKIPTIEELKKYKNVITTEYDNMSSGDLITKSDVINKNLVILNRYLGSFQSETNRKKLAEYNKFIIDNTTNLFTEIEGATRQVPIDIEGEIPILKGKANQLKIIISQEFYKDPRFIDLASEGVDINNINEVNRFFKDPKFTEAFLKGRIKRYNDQRKTGKRNVSMILNDIISNASDIGEENIQRRREEAEEQKRLQLIYNKIHRRYSDLNPSMKEVVLLFDEMVKTFVIPLPNNEEYLKQLDEVFNYAIRIKDKDYLLNEAISLFTIDDSAPDFLMNYVKTIEAMRRKGLLSDIESKRISKEEALAIRAEEGDVGGEEEDFEGVDDPAGALYNLKLDEGVYNKIYLDSIKILKEFTQNLADEGETEESLKDLDGMISSMETVYKEKKSLDILYNQILKGISNSLPPIKNFLNEQYNIFKSRKKKIVKTTKKVERTSESTTATEAREYILDKLSNFTHKDYFERFLDLRTSYPAYNFHLKTRSGSDYKNYMSFKGAEKNDIKNLYDAVLRNEFGGTDPKDSGVFIGNLVASENYNPKIEKFQHYPKQGFGMKKPKKKKGGDLIHIDIGSHIGKHYKEASGKGVGRQMKLFEKAKKDYQSGGDQPYIKSRIKVGSGVQVEETKPKYEQFGKFIIHTPQLHKNILNFKYPSEGRVPNLPRMNIDDDTKDLIFNILETGKMSENQFNKLPQASQDHLIKAIKGAGLENILFKGKSKVYPKDEKEDRERFNILKGEFDAGNDNPKLIKELRGLVIKFSNSGIIPKKQGLEFLNILNEI